jgi:hypothetical protein
VFTDNPVQISTLGGVGSIDCVLSFINSTNIRCRVGKANKAAGTTGKMLTFLKASEEATCTPDNTCDWTYTSSIPTVTHMGADYNTTHNYWYVRVDGSNFAGSLARTVFEVNGAKQETMELTSTYAIFKVTNIKGLVLRNMNLYFEVGYPEGYATVI